jgi:hypothetical protein
MVFVKRCLASIPPGFVEVVPNVFDFVFRISGEISGCAMHKGFVNQTVTQKKILIEMRNRSTSAD